LRVASGSTLGAFAKQIPNLLKACTLEIDGRHLLITRQESRSPPWEGIHSVHWRRRSLSAHSPTSFNNRRRPKRLPPEARAHPRIGCRQTRQALERATRLRVTCGLRFRPVALARSTTLILARPAYAIWTSSLRTEAALPYALRTPPLLKRGSRIPIVDARNTAMDRRV
jgi:hypothetical protein